jgi:hypothetical protein
MIVGKRSPVPFTRIAKLSGRLKPDFLFTEGSDFHHCREFRAESFHTSGDNFLGSTGPCGEGEKADSGKPLGTDFLGPVDEVSGGSPLAGNFGQSTAVGAVRAPHH